MNYWTPIIILVASNVIYNLCSKGAPAEMNPLAMLVMVYLIGALTAGIMYFTVGGGEDLLKEYRYMNWAAVLMGFTVVGLEYGSIYMYKVGWELSVGFLFSSALVAVSLLIIGVLVYHDEVSVSKIAGIVVSLVGMYLINK